MISVTLPPSTSTQSRDTTHLYRLLGIQYQVFMFVWLFLYTLGSLPRAKVVLLLGLVKKNIISIQTMKGECWQILLKYCLERRLRFLHELILKLWSPPCFILSLDQSDDKSFVEMRLVTNFTRFFFHYFYVLRLSLILVA